MLAVDLTRATCFGLTVSGTFTTAPRGFPLWGSRVPRKGTSACERHPLWLLRLEGQSGYEEVAEVWTQGTVS